MKISTLAENKKSSFLKQTAVICFWLLAWEIASRIVNAQVYFPSFFSTLRALGALSGQSYFWISVVTSLARVCSGFALSMLSGLILGLICSFSEFANSMISSLMVIIKSTPVASFIILSLIWFKTSQVPVFICFLMLLPIMFENVISGVRSIDVKLLQVCKIYKISTWDYFSKVIVPSIKPYINAALIASFGLGWKACISAEVLSRPAIAIGTGLYDSKLYLETPNLFAWTLTVIILSYGFERIIRILASKRQEGGK